MSEVLPMTEQQMKAALKALRAQRKAERLAKRERLDERLDEIRRHREALGIAKHKVGQLRQQRHALILEARTRRDQIAKVRVELDGILAELSELKKLLRVAYDERRAARGALSKLSREVRNG